MKKDNIDIKYYKNFSRLLSIRDNSFNSMILYFYFKVGSKYETLNISGISHYLEHMVFKGTDNYPTHVEINKTLDSQGIDFNAFTDKHMTAYHFKFIPNKDVLKLVCKIANEMVFYPLNRIKDINTERNIITQELNDMLDSPDEHIDELLECNFFEGHQLGQSVLGNVKSLHNITKKEIDLYHKKYYKKENLVVAICGNFNKSHIDIIEKYVIKSESRKVISNKPMTLFPINFEFKKKMVYIKKRLEQNHLVLLFPTKGILDRNRYCYKMIVNILGGNMSSKLFVKIREELGLAYEISCSLQEYEESGYFQIYTKCKSNDTIKALDNIIKLISSFKKNEIKQKELLESKKNYQDTFITGFDDLETKCEFYSEQLLLLNKVDNYTKSLQVINNISKQILLKVSNELFNYNRMMVMVMGKIDLKKINYFINQIIN